MSDVPTDVCPNCGGTGEIDGLVVGDDIRVERCHACHGTGGYTPDGLERAAADTELAAEQRHGPT